MKKIFSLCFLVAMVCGYGIAMADCTHREAKSSSTFDHGDPIPCGEDPPFPSGPLCRDKVETIVYTCSAEQLHNCVVQAGMPRIIETTASCPDQVNCDLVTQITPGPGKVTALCD